MKKKVFLGSVFMLSLCITSCQISLIHKDNTNTKGSTDFITSTDTEYSGVPSGYIPSGYSSDFSMESSDVTSSSEQTSHYSNPSTSRPSSSSSKSSSSLSSRPSSNSSSSSRPSSSSSSSSSSQGGQTAGQFIFNEAELNTPQEIHTDNQKNFLNYSGEYYHITSTELDSYGATGNASNGAPKQVTVNWNYTAPTGKTLSKFTFVTGQKADLSDGYEITGTTANSISFYNAYLGDNYFKVIANFTDNTKQESDIKVFKVDTQAPRNLKIGSMENCRDTGGRTTYAGGKVRQGLIYRTAEPGSNPSTEIKNTMANVLKVKSEIYVKDDGAGKTSPLSNVTFFDCSMDYGASPYSNLSRNAERLRKVFSVLADINNYPVFYHCRIGTDRTGITGIAINGLIGIPFNEVIQDYSFSNFSKIDGQRYTNKPSDPNGDDPAKYIDEILKMPGKNFQEQVYYSLLSIGIPKATLDTVIDIMTEGTKAVLPTTMKVGYIDNMTLNNTSKLTANDYKNPDAYAEISSGKSVSYTVNVAEGKKDIVLYAGSKSTSGNLADHVELKIDNETKTINNKAMSLAGFGTTQQSKRTGYMFNILGSFDLSEGEHVITVAGKSSTALYVGTVSVLDRGESGQGGGGTTPHTDHTFVYSGDISETGKTTYQVGTCTCGMKSVKWAVNANVAGEPNKRPFKLSADGNSATYTFNCVGGITGKLYILAGVDNYSSNKGYGLFYRGEPNLQFEINGVVATITNTKSYEECGVQSGGDSDESKAALMEVCAASLTNGSNTVKVTRINTRSAHIYDYFVIGE